MFFCQKSNIFILLHLSTASGSQKSSSMIFQRKSIPDLWIAVQSIWNFMEISQVFCIVIHRHNDERETAARWRKLYKSGTMDSLRKGVPAMVIKYTEEQLNSVDKSMLILANKNRFGRSSEKMEDTQQMRFIDFPQTGLTTT